MIRISRADLEAILGAAQSALPNECCGLLIGRKDAGGIQITRAVASGNMSETPARAFEIDPEMHLALQKQSRSEGFMIVGVYHSHPVGSPVPSEQDRAQAVESDWIWLIVAGAEYGAYRFDGLEFRSEELTVQ